MSKQILHYFSKPDAAMQGRTEFHHMGIGEILMFGCWGALMLIVAAAILS